MSKITGKGVPKPAILNDIICDLFKNEKTKNLDQTISKLTFSKAKLTFDQKKSLSYPKNFKPLDVYLIFQTDTKNLKGEITSKLELVSFTQKNDGFIYGFYFIILNQPRYKIGELEESHKSIKINKKAKFVSFKYIEVYQKIKDTTILVSYSDDKNDKGASLQYADRKKYYFEVLNLNGINNPQLQAFYLTGISKNLEKFCH